MNPGMLNDPAIIDKVYTPSFNLLELEAKILQYGSLAKLSSMISKCIRCGKCMPVCCVYHPGSNIFFHPRNKNMVIGSLIEALLYDMQRTHLPRFNQLKNLEEIADHCTLCRKCLAPCPVDIDTAEVSLLEREILSDLGYKHTAPATLMSLYYLKIRNRSFNTVFRKGVLQWGGDLQRWAAQAYKKAPAAITDQRWRFLNMFKSPMMPASTTSLGARLPYYSEREALMINPEGQVGKTVFYFPGCGSERLYADIATAAIYLLAKNNIRVVYPAAVAMLRFSGQGQRQKEDGIDHQPARHDHPDPDPGHARASGVRRLSRQLRHLPRVPARNGGQRDLRLPDDRYLAVRHGKREWSVRPPPAGDGAVPHALPRLLRWGRTKAAGAVVPGGAECRQLLFRGRDPGRLETGYRLCHART